MRSIETIKDDWATTKTRLTHWWANELYDRAVLLVTAPKDGAEPGAPWPGGEVRPRALVRLRVIQNTGGDNIAFPNLMGLSELEVIPAAE